MRTTTLSFGCLLLAAVLGAQLSPVSRKAQGLIQAAQTMETVHGDLKGAIELYRRAAREAGADHSTATRALLSLAACYEKQGAADARKVYEEILVKYPNPKEAVIVARRKLGQTGEPAATAPRVRQVWAGPDVDAEGGVSPDGRWLTYPHWATGDLGVRDLRNGSHKLLTNTGGWKKSGGQFAQDSIFSPDGKQIAYNWFTKDGYELRVMNSEGSGVRTLAFKDVPGYAVPRAWSPDGGTIAVHHGDTAGLNSLHLVSVTSGELHQVIPPGVLQFWGMSFSSDGQWLALDMKDDRSGSSDIYLLPLNGGSPVKLVENPAEDMSPVWSADGKALHFLSNRSGSYGLWMVPVSGGRVSGPAVLVRGDLGSSVAGIGFTRTGSYVYNLGIGGRDIYEVDYDPVAAKTTSRPRLVSDRVPGRNQTPAYSPDGRYLAWIRAEWFARRAALVLHDLTSADERSYELSGPVMGVGWSPDSSRIVIQSRRDEPNTWSVFAFDLRSEKFSELLKVHPARNPLSPCFSADGKALFYIWREWPKEGFQVMAVDLESGAKRSVYQSNSRLYATRLTPDGRNLGVLRYDGRERRSLLILPIEGGEPRVAAAFESKGGDFFTGFSFTPDGKSAIVRANLDEKPKQSSDLLSIDLSSGKVSPLGTGMSAIGYPGVHPSGSKIVFAAGESANEIWVAENILPPGN